MRAKRPEWWNEAGNWQPVPGAPVPPGLPARLFQEYCSACHGPAGRGDGPLVPQLARPPRDLTRAAWIFLSRSEPAGAERLVLARIIKFGLNGSEMAGREYLTDAEVVALAAYVQTMRGAP